MGNAVAVRALDAARMVGGTLADAGGALLRSLALAAAPLMAWVRANPLPAAARTVVLLALGVTVHNALHAQPGAHAAPWFVSAAEATQTQPTDTTVAAPKRARIADPVVFGIQSELTDRGYYDGTIDGLNGSRTSAAIRLYEESVGITPRGEATSALLDRIRLGPVTALPKPDANSTASIPAAEPTEPNPTLLVQRGLVAYGESIATDGVMGPMTRAAIENFQGAHGMEVTGEPSPAVVERMRAEGLL